MKSQLLYVVLLAAPLLIQVFTRETKVSPAAEPADSTRTAPALAEPTAKPHTPAKAKTAPARPRQQIPAAHSFTFM